jgi:hypothetical protein
VLCTWCVPLIGARCKGHATGASRAANFGRYRCIADSGKSSAWLIYGFTVFWAIPRASLRSVLTVIADSAAFTCRVSSRTVSNPAFLSPHAAIATAAQSPARSASLQSQASQKIQLKRRVRSRPSPPLGFYPGYPQRTRSTVPMTRRFRHSSPRLSSVRRCLEPTQVVTPFDHLSGGSHHHDPLLGAGPITASSSHP